MTEAESLELVFRQHREISEVRNQQLARDGRVYEPVAQVWLLANGRREPAWTAEEETNASQ